MEEHNKIIITLAVIGAFIGLGKMLDGNEPITIRLFLSRLILGSAVSVMAGALLVLDCLSGKLNLYRVC